MLSRLGKILITIAVLVIAFYVLYPIYVLVLVSISPIKSTLQSSLPSNLPSLHSSLANFYEAVFTLGLVKPMLKSFYIALVVGGLAMLMGIPAAYGLSKLPSRTANMISTTLFFANMLPAVTIAIPISATFIHYHLYDTVLGVALAQELIVLPLTIFLILGAFQGLPSDLEYQARVDGAGIFTTMYKILIPLSMGAIASAFLLSFMMSWDEYTFALIISPTPPTLPVIIYENITRGPITASTAFALLVTIPVLIMTVFLSKFLKAEYLSGGLVG